MLTQVKKSMLHPDCPECETTMEETDTETTMDEIEYTCPKCGETLYLTTNNSSQFGRPASH